MRVVWKRRALQDLENIATYIAERDARASRTLIARIRDAVATLTTFPYSGRIGRAEGMRELMMT